MGERLQLGSLSLKPYGYKSRLARLDQQPGETSGDSVSAAVPVSAPIIYGNGQPGDHHLGVQRDRLSRFPKSPRYFAMFPLRLPFCFLK